MTHDKRRFDEQGDRAAVAEPEKPKFKIIPRGAWVLIRQHKVEEVKTEGGVIIPGADFFLSGGDSTKQRGVIVAVGPQSDLKAGELVLFTNYSIHIADIEDLTGDADLKLVRDEEVYTRVEACAE